jgi:bifunctional oligoribonuclease and PAP phosphatase NrnA
MPVDLTVIELAGEHIRSADRILLISHIRPDGDAIGSLIGFGLALQEVGKKVQMVIEDSGISSFSFLHGSNQVTKKVDGEFDLICTLDCSDLERTGNVFASGISPDINIDHHFTNPLFAKINLVDGQAVATAEMIAAFLPQWGLPVTKEVSEALLTGIITDTIGFQTSNMRPSALRVAANLMEAGANLSHLYHLALVNHSYDTMRLWGIGLGNLRRKDRLIWTTITLQERESISYPGRDDGDLVNLLGTVDGIDIAMIMTEQPDNYVKVSWRSRKGFDVSQLAASFGGGGHPAASGAVIQGSLPEVQKLMVETTLLLVK